MMKSPSQGDSKLVELFSTNLRKYANSEEMAMYVKKDFSFFLLFSCFFLNFLSN